MMGVMNNELMEMTMLLDPCDALSLPSLRDEPFEEKAPMHLGDFSLVASKMNHLPQEVLKYKELPHVHECSNPLLYSGRQVTSEWFCDTLQFDAGKSEVSNDNDFEFNSGRLPLYSTVVAHIQETDLFKYSSWYKDTLAFSMEQETSPQSNTFEWENVEQPTWSRIVLHQLLACAASHSETTLASHYRNLAKEVVDLKACRYEIISHVMCCCADIVERNGSFRLLEAYLMELEEFKILQAIIPEYQTQILVNQEELCSSKGIARDVSLALMCPQKGRVVTLEREMEVVTYILDSKTGVILPQEKLNAEYIQGITRWIVRKGRSMFEHLWIIVVENCTTHSKSTSDLLNACCKLTPNIPTTLRMVANCQQAANLIRDIALNHCIHSQNQNCYYDSISNQSSRSLTSQEFILSKMPFVNAYTAYALSRNKHTETSPVRLFIQNLPTLSMEVI